jgi:hypothetical protein
MRKTKLKIKNLISKQRKINSELYDEFHSFSLECDYKGRIENTYVSKCFCPNDGICFNYTGRCWLSSCPIFHDAQTEGSFRVMSTFRW